MKLNRIRATSPQHEDSGGKTPPQPALLWGGLARETSAFPLSQLIEELQLSKQAAGQRKFLAVDLTVRLAYRDKQSSRDVQEIPWVASEK